ncbi:hypothetical protein [Segnochrobactrum spirostomi]|uniref:Uncharacterized protein n=1 Tax=Segnochrobactrum spirostomi TaxID=2608987 RepID=A0A6A7Y6Y4_9HYPH|nr:hypothetical protein [Segnochrobactrum spirostomi]MQT14465.1 hypothetical protein [Segnochrobactrum spirostomi]
MLKIDRKTRTAALALVAGLTFGAASAAAQTAPVTRADPSESPRVTDSDNLGAILKPDANAKFSTTPPVTRADSLERPSAKGNDIVKKLMKGDKKAKLDKTPPVTRTGDDSVQANTASE